jgi:GH25 family lysozyme M1 (1,4-beta-N-acetylmuramidase)
MKYLRFHQTCCLIWVLNWLSLVTKEYNTSPIVYTAEWYYNSYMRNTTKTSLNKLADYPLWVAASYNTMAEIERKIPNWGNWITWQRAGSCQASGVSGRCDQNWMAGGQLSSLRMP